MGKVVKRGKQGNAARYITRNQAIKKLQLRLSEFRRLCILKGIHPREPKKKVQGQNKTYYHLKDILFLAHEPLLNKFRDLIAYNRKVRKARAKRNFELAQRLLDRKPGYRLDHLVKERYPSLVDALRDLDDALTMVHLFATLPAEVKYEIPRRVVNKSRRLALEWQAWVARAHALRKVFVSVKGYSYQAEVLGQPVTWLVPHQLMQVLPPDVDYRVMLTFLEFYTAALEFVLYRLYHDIGLKYPPVVDPKVREMKDELASIMSELAGRGDSSEDAQRTVEAAGLADAAVLQRVAGKEELAEVKEEEEEEEEGGVVVEMAAEEDEDEDDEDEDDEDEGAGEDKEGGRGGGLPGADAVAVPQEDVAEGSGVGSAVEAASLAGGATEVEPDDEEGICRTLFQGMVVFLAREVPREPLMFVIRCFGGVAAWDGAGSPVQENDETITHQVVDRPVQGQRFLSRQYVQPQWVLDCANFRILVPCGKYVPGVKPPPHLSPYVAAQDDEYLPDYQKTLQQLQQAAAAFRQGGAEAAGGWAADASGPAGPGDTPGPVEEDAATAELRYHEELAQELSQAAPEEGRADAGAASKRQASKATAPKKRRKPSQTEPDATQHAADETVMEAAMLSRKDRFIYHAIKKKEAGMKAQKDKLALRKQQLAQQRKRKPAKAAQ